MKLSELERLAREAKEESGEDWFDPECVESQEPIYSTAKARRLIAAANPQTILRMIEVIKVVSTEALSALDCAAQGDTSDCAAAAASLRSALKEMEK